MSWSHQDGQILRPKAPAEFYCEPCGWVVAEGSRFCGKYGAEVRERVASPIV